MVLINTIYGVNNSDKDRIKYAEMEGASPFLIYKEVLLPSILPSTFGGLRIALSLSLIIIIVSEMFVGTYQGIGQKIMDYHLTYKIPQMYSSILITGMLGYLINILFLKFEKRIVHWSL